MATSTELYINAELPKRIYTDQFPLTAGHVPVATGNALQVTARQLDVTDVANAASEQYVTDAISALIDGAPAALDTLNELAAALGDDANYASTVATALGNRLRVDVNTQGLTATEQQNGMDNLGVSEVITGASIDGSGLITFTKNGLNASDTIQVSVDKMDVEHPISNALVLESNKRYIVPLTVFGVVSVTLPPTPAANDKIIISDVFGKVDTLTSFTINGSGTGINNQIYGVGNPGSSAVTSYTDNTKVPYQEMEFHFQAGTGWVVSHKYSDSWHPTTGNSAFKLFNTTSKGGVSFDISDINLADFKTIKMPYRDVDLGKMIESIYTFDNAPYALPAGTNQRLVLADSSKSLNLDTIQYTGNVCEIVSIAGVIITNNGAVQWKDGTEANIAGLTLVGGESITAISYGGNILIVRSEVLANAFKILKSGRSTGGAYFDVSNTTALRSITVPNRNIDLDGIGAIPDHFSGVSYTIGQNVYYGGQEFRCRTAHTSATAEPDYTKFTPVSGTLHITNSSAVTITPPANDEIKSLIITSTSSFTLNSAVYPGYPVTIVSNNALPDWQNYITVSATPSAMKENGVTVKNIMLRGGESATVTQGNCWTKGRVNTTDWAAYDRYDAGDLIIKDGTLLKVSSAHSGDAAFYPTTYNATVPLTIPGCKVSKDYLGQQLGWTANFLNASSTYSMVLFGNNNSIRNVGDGKAVLSGTANTIGYQTNNGLTTVSSSGSLICGGQNNSVTIDTASEYASCLVGGYLNAVSGAGSFLGGGSGNKSSGNYNVVCGGQNNSTIYNGGSVGNRGGSYGFIGNGQANSILHGNTKQYSAILNGTSNSISGELHGAILNGTLNSIGVGGDFGLVGNGNSNSVTGARSTVVNGSMNTASGARATVLNGTSSTASGSQSVVLNGYANVASGPESIVGGNYNTASGASAVVLAGGGASFSNTASGNFSTILNGRNNIAAGVYSCILTGTQNNISGQGAVVLAGDNNTTTKNSVVMVNARNIPDVSTTAGDTIFFNGIGATSYFKPCKVGHSLSGFALDVTLEATTNGTAGSATNRIKAVSTSSNGGAIRLAMHDVDIMVSSNSALGGNAGTWVGKRLVMVSYDGTTATILSSTMIGTDYISGYTSQSAVFTLSGTDLICTINADGAAGQYGLLAQVVITSSYGNM